MKLYLGELEKLILLNKILQANKVIAEGVGEHLIKKVSCTQFEHFACNIDRYFRLLEYLANI